MRARRVILANYHKAKKRGIGIMSTHLPLSRGPCMATNKVRRPDVVMPGGPDGGKVLGIKGPPNSFIRGGGDHVFETDAQGKVIRDISLSLNRVKVRKQHNAGSKGIFEDMVKDGPPNAADIALLRQMGIIK
jgi:hypothetical protein